MGQRLVWRSAVLPRFGGEKLYLMATGEGLCRITWPNEEAGALQAWRDRHAPGAELVQDDEALLPAVRELEEYLEGERRQFGLPLDLRGTPFQLRIWEELRRIPYGSTRSYAELAAAVGRPAAVRAAGAANGANPVPLLVPCHRVIGKNGSLTGFRGGLAVKETLLRLEGVPFG
ncbi:methylated-DNA--[protein]-cysteine S-methyltransferase [Gorillibacterium sp. sgz5001074]|uniref:methylated-DNA--[protein]-cysteine S-methyltransferase n=1 Tax=Gorillibacterium sp. sgz5001074 TaxID=3446695 RepID=UPI003F667A41